MNLFVLNVLAAAPLTAPRTPWVSVRLDGRLGNNMFQVASAMGLAHLHQAQLCVDQGPAKTELNRIFARELPPDCPPFVWFAEEEERGYATHQSFSIRKNTRVGHYLQSWKYFDSEELERWVREQFRFNPRILRQARRIVGEKSRHTVGIHVRRGDHVEKYDYLKFPPDEYYENIFKLYPRSRMIIVSDNIEWCTHYSVFQKHSDRISFLNTATTPAVDMAVLSLCDAVVLSVGTFGWWGGYLSGGEVVYTEDEFDMEHAINTGSVTKDDYYLPEWKAAPAPTPAPAPDSDAAVPQFKFKESH